MTIAVGDNATEGEDVDIKISSKISDSCARTVKKSKKNEDGMPEQHPSRAWQEIKDLPWVLFDTFRWDNIRAKGYPWWRNGDFDAFFALWGDNLGTQLVLISLFTVPGVPITRAVDKIMPGVGLSLIFGNIYYSFQASRIARRENRTDVCAQPYGINTPGALTKAFVIFQPTFYMLRSKGIGPEDAFDQALQAVTAGNFLSAIFEIIGAFFLPFVADRISSAALLTPIAGIGITWLGINQISEMVAVDPMVGLFSFVIVWYGTFGGGRLGSIPMGLFSIAMGTILSWCTGATRSVDHITQATESIGLHLGSPGICFQDWSRIHENLALLLPIAMTNALGSLECVRAAQEFGDNYNSVETMLVDGVGSIVGAMFGSPFGTTVYLGQPAYKKMGASRGYSLLNGTVFFLIGISGLHAFFDAIIPREAVVPVVAFVGLMIASETIDLTPRRLRPAILLGMLLPIFDWSDLIALKATGHVLGPLGGFNLTSSAVPFEVGGKVQCVNNFDFLTINSTQPTTIDNCIGTDLWKTQDEAHGFFTPGSPGIKIMRNGFLFLSLLWTLGASAIIDRMMLKAGFIWCIGSFLCFFGIIHSNDLGVPHGGTGTGRDGKHHPGWMFIGAYLMMAGFCFFIHGLQRYGYTDGPVHECDDEGAVKNDGFRDTHDSAGTTARNDDDDDEEENVEIMEAKRKLSRSLSQRSAVAVGGVDSSRAMARMDSMRSRCSDKKQSRCGGDGEKKTNGVLDSSFEA